MKTRRQRQHAINPPQHPRECRHAMTPCRCTYQDGHVNQRRKSHRKCRNEQALMWMAEDSKYQLRVANVPQERYEGEEYKEDKIEHEEDDGNNSEPVAVVG